MASNLWLAVEALNNSCHNNSYCNLTEFLLQQFATLQLGHNGNGTRPGLLGNAAARQDAAMQFIFDMLAKVGGATLYLQGNVVAQRNKSKDLEF